MPIIMLFGIGILILGLGEIMTLIWFLLRWVDVHRGNLNFKVSVWIPMTYLIYSSIVAWFVFQTRTVFFSEHVIPFDVRLRNSLIYFTLLNLTTPLYPLMATMKKRKQRLLNSVTADSNST